MAKQKLEAELGLNNKGFLAGLSESDGAVGKFAKGIGAMSIALAAAGAAFKLLIDWAKSTDFGMRALNMTMTVSKQLLTDLITGQGLHIREAISNAKAQSKINEDNAKEGWQLAKMNRELHELEVKAADQLLTTAQKKEILTKAMEKEHEIKEFLIADAKEELKAAWDNYKINQSSTKAREDFYKAAARLEEVQGQDSRRLLSQYTGVLEQEAEAAKKAADEIKKLADETQRLNNIYSERLITLREVLDTSGTIDTGRLKMPGFGMELPNTLMGTNNPGTIAGSMFNEFNITEQWRSAWESAIMEVTNFMADAFQEVFERIGSGSFDNLGKDLLGSFGRLVADFGKMLITLGTTWLLALTLMKTPTIPTAIAAIAAGVAATAIGGAMIGASKKAANSIQGGDYSGGGGYASGNGMQTVKVQVEGVIKGKDIYISNRRYIEDNG